MDKLVFFLDVDNTLLNNDALKADLAAEVRNLVGAEREQRFWEIYEEVRHEEDFVDFPTTLKHFAAEQPDAPNEDLHDLVNAVPFARYVYPGALDALTYLRTIGRPVILSDGDPVFQVQKIQRSGLAAAVEGRVVITVHKESELDRALQTYPATHYALIDDKPGILAAIERRYARQFTTVLVCQGKYARLRDVLPAPDIVVPHIADLVDIPQSDFLTETGLRDDASAPGLS